MIGFLRRLAHRRAVPDPEAFHADLKAATIRRDTYGAIDRYRDFRAVFLGHSTPEQGKRVLWQIFEWARMYHAIAVTGDAHQTYFRDGERTMGLRILRVLGAEPVERATQAQTEKPKE